ncbi:unnamed protein product [Moneuplotes crassus]|uniref:Uncharacterized protein n=1 Tax=Euplotes crassus TaxID=5936 RepID=A0AAD2CYH9_EUPCR|nr:unnamed protein product [Moneuplotes crassus]
MDRLDNSQDRSYGDHNRSFTGLTGNQKHGLHDIKKNITSDLYNAEISAINVDITGHDITNRYDPYEDNSVIEEEKGQHPGDKAYNILGLGISCDDQPEILHTEKSKRNKINKLFKKKKLKKIKFDTEIAVNDDGNQLVKGDDIIQRFQSDHFEKNKGLVPVDYNAANTQISENMHHSKDNKRRTEKKNQTVFTLQENLVTEEPRIRGGVVTNLTTTDMRMRNKNIYYTENPQLMKNELKRLRKRTKDAIQEKKRKARLFENYRKELQESIDPSFFD